MDDKKPCEPGTTDSILYKNDDEFLFLNQIINE